MFISQKTISEDLEHLYMPPFFCAPVTDFIFKLGAKKVFSRKLRTNLDGS
jgi:hypothetical protein